jgi:hypothetical protein
MTNTLQPATSAVGGSPAAGQPVYPLPAPEEDPRFTYGLVGDIADVLTGHGYPPPQATDWADLMTAVSGFLYQPDQPEQETR